MDADVIQLVIRMIPLVIWTLVTRRAPAEIARVEPSAEMRTRRMLPIYLVEGSLIAIFAGGLARIDLVSGGLSGLLYTSFGVCVAVVGLVLLRTYPRLRR